MKDIIDFFVAYGFKFDANKIDIYQKNVNGDTPINLAMKKNEIALAASMLSLMQDYLSAEIKQCGETMFTNSDSLGIDLNNSLTFSKLSVVSSENGGFPLTTVPSQTKKIDELKETGRKLIDKILKKIEESVSFKMEGESWFEQLIIEFKEWAFAVNDLLRIERDVLVSDESFLPFKPSISQEVGDFFDSCVDHYNDFVALRLQNEDLLNDHLNSQDHNALQSDDQVVLFHAIREDLENNILLGLTGVQMIAEMCHEALGQFPLRCRNQPIFEDMQAFQELCEDYLKDEQRKIEDELSKNLLQQIELEVMATYLHELTEELEAQGKQYSEWLNECSARNNDIMNEQRLMNQKMMTLLKIIRLGVPHKLQNEMMSKLEIEINNYNLRQCQESYASKSLSNFHVSFEHFDPTFIEDNTEYVNVWNRKAQQRGEVFMGELLNFRKQILMELSEFFYDHIKYVNEFCKLHNINCSTVDNFDFHLAPPSLSSQHFYPKGDEFVKFALAADLKMNDIFSLSQDLKSKIALLSEKIGYSKKMLIEYDNQRKMIVEQKNVTLNKINEIFQHVENFENLLLLNVPQNFDYEQLNNCDDKFSRLNIIADSILLECEDVSEFEKNSLNRQRINELQKYAIEQRLFLDKIDAEMEHLDKLQQEESESKLNLELEKLRLEGEVEIFKKEYIHLFLICKRISITKEILGKDFLAVVDGLKPVKAKHTAQKFMEDLCKIVSGCATDALAACWDSNVSVMRNNLSNFPLAIQKAGEFFWTQFESNLKNVKYDKKYIETQKLCVEKLWKILMSPSEDIFTKSISKGISI